MLVTAVISNRLVTSTPRSLTLGLSISFQNFWTNGLDSLRIKNFPNREPCTILQLGSQGLLHLATHLCFSWHKIQNQSKFKVLANICKLLLHLDAMRWFLLIVRTQDQLGLDRDPSPILKAASQPGPAWVPLLQGMNKVKEIDRNMWNIQPSRFGSLVVLQSSVSETKHQIKSYQIYCSYMFIITFVAFLDCLLGVGNIPCHICSPPHWPCRNHTCIVGCMPGARLRVGRHYVLHFRQ